MNAGVLSLLPSASSPGAAGSPVSVFEYVLQHQLLRSLKPAFDFLFARTFASGSRSPLAPYADEAFFVLSLLLHGRLLRSHGSLFSEYVHGFHRKEARGGRPEPTTSLRSSAIWWTLFLEVAVPYLKRKLDLLFEYCRELQLLQDSDPTQHGGLVRGPSDGPHPYVDTVRAAWTQAAASLRRLFLKSYPSIHACYELVGVFYLWRYAFGNSQFLSPSLHATNCLLVRGTPPSLGGTVPGEESSASSSPPSVLPSPSFRSLSSSSSPSSASQNSVPGRIVPSSSSDSGGNLLQYGFFGLLASFKILEWWYASRPNAPSFHAPSGPVPPPPLPPSVGGSHAVCRLPADRELCPLCLNPRSNAAAATSGVVYCYKCIYQHTTANGFCPVTGVPCPPHLLRKLYEGSD